MSYIERTIKVGNLTVEIVADDDASSPRDYDNGSLMLCWMRDYNVGDRDKYKGVIGSDIYDLRHQYLGWRQIEEKIRSEFEPACILPVFANNHGCSMSVWAGTELTSSEDDFSGNQVGFIFDNGEDLDGTGLLKVVQERLKCYEETIRIAFADAYDQEYETDEEEEDAARERAQKIREAVEAQRDLLRRELPGVNEAYTRLSECLNSQVEAYNDYVQGNVWGWVVRDDDGDVLDSCWGFIGDPDKSGVIEEGKSTAEWFIENEKKKDRMCEQIMHL